MANDHILEWLDELARTGDGELADFYPDSAEGTIEFRKGERYQGRRVSWKGCPEQTFKVKSEYVEPFWGNIFDKDKLRAIVDGIRQSSIKVAFNAAPAFVTQIDLQLVQESLTYDDDQMLKLTTGDVEMDRYLANSDQYLKDEFYLEPGDDDYDRVKQECEDRLKEVVEGGYGDIGEWMASLRDGDHRAFGAILAGEPYIWVCISSMQMTEINHYDRYGKLKKLLK